MTSLGLGKYYYNTSREKLVAVPCSHWQMLLKWLTGLLASASHIIYIHTIYATSQLEPINVNAFLIELYSCQCLFAACSAVWPTLFFELQFGGGMDVCWLFLFTWLPSLIRAPAMRIYECTITNICIRHTTPRLFLLWTPDFRENSIRLTMSGTGSLL